ncbi:FecR domain-containing protein [Chondromyces crocatus]|uniref:FecR protein domain-containing protein n=1 Tax=Chondromyces crocatus TaxID=52 RepID=A0A0K1E638_CHOCO|nr:FecR domain-containing protein [Chondromyces crocatus]AKT36033.1 uncharacterized protein CMC5_001450 [Chondromyces crocatus]
MKRRHVPRIDPLDLRDHATDERVARVWARIEQDLDVRGPATPRRAGFTVALLAAALSAFGGGLLVGRFTNESAPSQSPEVVASQDSPTLSDVIAAGSRERTYPLPGGGEISLTPGSTIELEHGQHGALTLRLVQGEASVDTAGNTRSALLSLVAGDARVSSAAGSVFRVRHNVDDIDVDVSDGAVQLESPLGSRELSRGDSAEGVPIRPRVTSLVAPPRSTAPAPRHARPAPTSAEEPPTEAPTEVSSAQDWRSRYNGGDEPGALSMLRQQSGGIDGAIASARTAKELMDLSDLLRSRGGDQVAAIRALTRVVDAFPGDTKYAEIAAFTLGNMHARLGDQVQAARNYERAGSLAPDGNLAQDSFCKRIGSEFLAGHKDEAIRMAQEYVSKYPDGRCEAVQRINSGGKEEDAEVENEAEPAAPREPSTPAPESSVPAP